MTLRPARLSVGVEAALAFAAGAVFFASASVILVANASDVLAAVLALLAVLTVVAMLRYWGVAFAVPAAIAVLLSFDWYVVPPKHPGRFPNADAQPSDHREGRNHEERQSLDVTQITFGILNLIYCCSIKSPTSQNGTA